MPEQNSTGFLHDFGKDKLVDKKFFSFQQSDGIHGHFSEPVLRSQFTFPFSLPAPTSNEHIVFLRQHITMCDGITINCEF